MIELNKFTTVCIPVFNGAEYLEACLTSVVAQTHTDIEILIVDDGSTDESLRIIGQFEAADSRVRLLRNEQNLGLARNWQHCIARSRGREQQRHKPPKRRFGSVRAGKPPARFATGAGPWPRPGRPAPKLRCGACRGPRPARVTPCRRAGPQTSTVRPAPARLALNSLSGYKPGNGI